jgi:imidazolonepropionase-like amidohydrolase
VQHAFVRIRDGRIAEVSETPLRGPREIDGTGRFLIPGLIDSHVHTMQGIPGMPFGADENDLQLAAAVRDQEPRSYLYFGFTTVVDLNAPNAEAMKRWADAEVRPDIHFCGSAPIANGFPMTVVPEAFRFNVYKYFLFDEAQVERIPASVDPVEHTPEASVARMAADGALCVKIYYQPGTTPTAPLPTPSLDMIRAVVAAAHARDLPVVIHANTKDAQAFAVQTGVDVITHTIGNGLSLNSATLDDDVLAILRAVVAQNIGYQPTLQAILYANLAQFDEKYLEDPRIAHAVPPDLAAWFPTPEGGWFREQMLSRNNGAIPPVPLVTSIRSYDQVLRYLAESDARLVFGSDTPATQSYGALPGFSGRLEMNRWIGAGVSEAQLFRALTIDNARVFGLDREIGTIEVGKLAHLVVLDSNPLESVAAYDSIEMVLLRGEPIERGELSAVR